MTNPTDHHPGADRLAESEWRQARRQPGPADHPALMQDHHGNDQAAARLRGIEWLAARPTDHAKRKAIVGRGQPGLQ